MEEVFKGDRLLHKHTQYYVREMRIRAYSQLLQSYKSLTLASMAKSFGVSVRFIDTELSRFVAAGRLNCKIDKVGGAVMSRVSLPSVVRVLTLAPLIGRGDCGDHAAG